MTRLFISYRTDDSGHAVTALAGRLGDHFGPENIFRDRDSLALGTSYPAPIRRALERSDVVLAVIGASWLDLMDNAGRPRIDDPRDWVRTELRMAFERKIPVVPVLLDHTPLPAPDRLPADIRSLPLSTCWHVRYETFESDVRGLIDGITRATGDEVRSPHPPTGSNIQYNTSSGGPVIANQGGGTQHIHGIDLGRGTR